MLEEFPMEDNDKPIAPHHGEVKNPMEVFVGLQNVFVGTYNKTMHEVEDVSFGVRVGVLGSQEGLNPVSLFLHETIAEGIKKTGESKRGLDVRDTRRGLAEAARGPLLLGYGRR
jgi:hypothetical protein